MLSTSTITRPALPRNCSCSTRTLTIVVYCRSGNRSSQAMSTFEEFGFTNVTEIDGGIVEWLSSGLPMVSR